MKIFEKMKKKVSVMLALAMVFGLVQGASVDLSKVFARTFDQDREISGCAVVDMGEIGLDEAKEVEIKADEMLAFTFTAPEDGTYYFFTEGNSDTYGVLAKDSELVTIVASNDDTNRSNFSIKKEMQKDETYVIAVRAYNTSKDLETTVKVMTEEAFVEYAENYISYEISGTAVAVTPDEKTELTPVVYATDYYGNIKGHYEDEEEYEDFAYDAVDTTDFTFAWYDANDFEENGEEAKVLATTLSMEVTLPSNTYASYTVVMTDTQGRKSETTQVAYTTDYKKMSKYNYKYFYFTKDEKVEIGASIYYRDYYGYIVGEVEDFSNYTFVWTHRNVVVGETQKLEIAEPDNNHRRYTCNIYDGETLVAKTICYVNTNHEHDYEIIDVLSATCTEGSKAVKACWMCGHKEEVVLSPALGHDYKEASKVDATATTDGYVEYKCTRCEDTYKDVIKATGETTTVDQNNETTTVDQNNETTSAAVKPATVKKATVKAAKKSIKISFTKAKNAKKYIVQVSKNKKFKKLVKTVKNLKKTKTTIKKMKKGKYFVRIAGVNGKTKGAWSKAFKVTVK